jgi:hypothetical protein
VCRSTLARVEGRKATQGFTCIRCSCARSNLSCSAQRPCADGTAQARQATLGRAPNACDKHTQTPARARNETAAGRLSAAGLGGDATQPGRHGSPSSHARPRTSRPHGVASDRCARLRAAPVRPAQCYGRPVCGSSVRWQRLSFDSGTCAVARPLATETAGSAPSRFTREVQGPRLGPLSVKAARLVPGLG